MDIQLESISVIAELERIGWAYEAESDEELRVKCPAHADDSPSCSINTTKRLFNCKAASCRVAGDFVTFLSLALKAPRSTIIEDLATRYGAEESKVIDAETVERFHQAIWTKQALPLRAELYKRGVSDDLIRKYRLGFDQGRIQIPIANENGAYVNIRKYLPGAPGKEKMKNLRGHGKVRLYPLDQLQYDTIVVCGGEMKAIATAERMNRYGVGAITAAGGEGSWSHDFNKLFRGKRVFICMDVDQGGRVAAEAMCARLSGEARWVGRIDLPLNIDKYPKGDLNDFFGVEKRTGEDLLKVMDAVQRWEPRELKETEVAPSEAELIHLSQATQASKTGKRIRLRAIVPAMDETPYIVPKKIACSCPRNTDFCPICPVYARTPDDNGAVVESVNPESPGILHMVGASAASQKDAIRVTLRIPPCKAVSFKPLEYYNVQDVRLSPQLSIASRDADHIEQPAYVIGHGLVTNTSYEFEGRCYPHPKTQQAVILASSAVPAEDALGTFKPGHDELEPLRLFQPTDWSLESLEKKLDEIYADIETNVTRIFKRRHVHLAVDLTFHTVLLMQFDGRRVKGWGEVLICGDSSQGKSETALRLIEHFGLGERVVLKTATTAGLLGGLREMGKRFFISWGIIPTHDKRLVVLDELKGAPVEVLAKLTDMRSSGIAEIDKIEKRRTHARTRLVAISNPRNDRPVSAANFGIETIKELIGALEDIRRFDFAVIVSANQIDPHELEELVNHRPAVSHVYTAELCQRLVLWAWTRAESQVIFEPETIDTIMAAAAQLCDEFTEAVPLIDRGTTRFKIARLAAGLACRTFSCDEDMTSVIVRPCHVQFVVNMIRTVYGDHVFGYKDFSNALKMADELKDEGEIRKRLFQLPFPADFVEQMLYASDISLNDICDWCGYDRGEGIDLLSFFVRKHALQRMQRGYKKTSAFIKFLKQLKESGDLTKHDRPSFIKERF